MDNYITIQGQSLSSADIGQIRELISSHPDWNRTRLSRELCRLWDWRTPTGQIKDMACRTMLLKLHRRGFISLPARQLENVNQGRGKSFQPVFHSTCPIECSLSDLGEVTLSIADSGDMQKLWRTLLHCYHYLGFSTRVGKSICYLALDSGQRPVGALLFGAAAWKVGGRDSFIGWDHCLRRQNLDFIVNNMRFLIPPWVRVPHLASHLLALAARRLNSDWQKKYGHEVVLLETFVEKSRFRGTCYKAANWIHVGETAGRTRNDARHDISAQVKAVYVYPLRRDFRRVLTQTDKE